LQAQTIGGPGNTATLTSRGREFATEDNVNKRWRALRVVTPAGSLRGTLAAIGATTSTTELSTSLSGQNHATGQSLSSVAAQDGDYIVVELGYGESASGTTPNWDMVLGGSGTDHANNNNDTTGSVPWVEFSQDLAFMAAGSVDLTPAALSLTTQPVTAVPGAVTVSLTPAAATLAAQQLDPVPGAVTVPLTPAAAVLAAVALDPVPGPVTTDLTPAVLAVAAQALAPVPVAVTVDLVPAELALGAVALEPLAAVGTTPRPNTGTTPRTAGGVTARPSTGVTPRP
jgi:hypothetical protein